MEGGLLWNQYTDPIEGENVVIYTQNKTKTKYEDKNHSKMMQNA